MLFLRLTLQYPFLLISLKAAVKIPRSHAAKALPKLKNKHAKSSVRTPLRRKCALELISIRYYNT